MRRKQRRQWPPRRGPSSRYWFIVKNEYGRIEALSIDLNGQEAMPIFSFGEEAEMFIRFEAWGDWSVRETSAGELISLLSGPYSDVKMVALDPPTRDLRQRDEMSRKRK
jgi:hypothetical protein